jgi:Aminoglycoside-2''-adenylyltransferase
MPAEPQLNAVDEVHRRFAAAGVDYWLFGGWAVDFHAGAITRAHADVDLAIWLGDLPRVAALLGQDGWVHEPDGAADGSTAFVRGPVRLELAFLERDGAEEEPYTPLANGDRAAWAAGAFGPDVVELAGVRARVIALAALREEKTGPRADPAAEAKDRRDLATLAGL